jgi:ABC-2 type transport system permease protein
MNITLVTARQEIRSLRREKLAQALLVVFVSMVSLSSFIGWLTNRNVTGIYGKVKEQGFTSAPNPFANVPALYYLRNTVIYLVLIGALLAIVLGVASILRDRKARTVDLVLVRPIHANSYLLGKLSGIALWLAMILSLVACISWISISVIIGKPLAGIDTRRMIFFFVLSLLFLLGFVLLGMICAIYSARETSALLLPIAIWSVITFVLPQLGTADHPVSLLNPVPAIPNQGGAFSTLNSIFSPLSITEQFKKVSSWAFGSPDNFGSPNTSLTVLIAVFIIGTFGLLITKRDRLRRGLYE